MCNPPSHNTGCYEGTWRRCWAWACVRCATWENREATWENKDKVALLQKGTVGPKLSQRHGAQSLSLFSTPETQDGKKVTKSASILMGEVLTQELH